MPEFEIKDSGKRYTNENGGVRDTDEGKFDPVYIPTPLIIKYAINKAYIPIFKSCRDIRLGNYNNNVDIYIDTLCRIIEMCVEMFEKNESLESVAMFLESASKKYSFENWRKLTNKDDFFRFRRSLLRHAYKCVMGYDDEPHHEAVIFNAVCLIENFKDKVNLILYENEPEEYALKGRTDTIPEQLCEEEINKVNVNYVVTKTKFEKEIEGE